MPVCFSLFKPAIVFGIIFSLLFSTSFEKKAYAGEIVIAADVGLAYIFKDLIASYHKKTGRKVTALHASSHTLLGMLESGKEADIFAPSDQQTMQRAQNRSLIDAETRKNFAKNSLVVIVPSNSEHVPKNPKELFNPVYKTIALAQIPLLPLGRYSQDALRNELLWNNLEYRFVFAVNSRYILDYVANNEVSAGIVYKTDLTSKNENIIEATTLEGTIPILYPVAILKQTKHKELAQDFIDYITSNEVRAIKEKHGFLDPSI